MRIGVRGATLVEVLVVGGVFGVLLTAILMVYTTTVRAERSISLKSDVDRVLMAAVRHVDSSLKSSRLVRPDDLTDPQYHTAIELAPLERGGDGEPLVTVDGYPVWGDLFTISFEEGKLFRMAPDRRVLAQVGDGGYVKFIRPSWRILQMEIKVEKSGIQGAKNAREAKFQFRLFNQ